ncbi:hypothetical protein BC941DRAFT_164021 [Chlamydoabsidia padenii]|nr:hypothetical protein BC941DRAFT_164021 [Chlamydoabsidia padenii]
MKMIRWFDVKESSHIYTWTEYQLDPKVYIHIYIYINCPYLIYALVIITKPSTQVSSFSI